MTFLPKNQAPSIPILAENAAGLFALRRSGGRVLGYIHHDETIQVPDSSTSVGGLSWFSAMNQFWHQLVARLRHDAAARYPECNIITGVHITLDAISDTVGTWTIRGTACVLPTLPKTMIMLSHHNILRTLNAVEAGFVPLDVFAVATESNQRYQSCDAFYLNTQHERGLTQSRRATITSLTGLLTAAAKEHARGSTPLHVRRGRTIITSFRSKPESEAPTKDLIMDVMASASGQSYLDLHRQKSADKPSGDRVQPLLEIPIGRRDAQGEPAVDFHQFPVLGTATYQNYERPELVSSDLHNETLGEECPEHPRDLVNRIESWDMSGRTSRGNEARGAEGGFEEEPARPQGPGLMARALVALSRAFSDPD